VVFDGCRVVKYRQFVVCLGLKLDWDAVERLAQSLGCHGVTSNYCYDLAPYTRELVQGLHGGRAVFTQPPLPIKSADAQEKGRCTFRPTTGGAAARSRTSRSTSTARVRRSLAWRPVCRH
jgi:hypothetical protein